MPILSAFPGFCLLLELNRRRWFPRTIIQYSVNVFHFINDPAGCPSDYFPWDLCALCCHKVCCGHCSQCNGVVIGSFISHNAHRLHIGQSCEILADLPVNAGFSDFFSPDSVGVLYHLYFLSSYFADDTDTKSRAWEWLSENKIL